MAETPDTLRHGELLNRLVIDIDTTEEVGRVSEVLVDSKTHQVEGLVCKTGLLSRERHTFSWVQIESIGKDSVVINPRLTDHAPQRLAEAYPMTGEEIWSDAGDRVGRLVDYRFNARTGLILAYGFITEGLRGLTDDAYTLAPDAIISIGRKRIMVREAAVANPTIFEAGWAKKAVSAAEGLKEEYAQTQAHLHTARQQSQEVSAQLQDQARKLKEQATGQWQQVFGQVKKRTRKLRNQIRETVTDVSANLPAGQRADREDVIIDVDSIEVWPEEDFPPEPPSSPIR
ncbi:MAG TPA: PRC-barrel domain-containing protein [Leptolyngbyaceae cyanobacterium]